jgi:hypothetical protein
VHGVEVMDAIIASAESRALVDLPPR